jgi:hypothetical protein
MWKAQGLTTTSRHTMNDDILLLGDEFLDQVYTVSLDICGSTRDLLDTACWDVFRPTPNDQLINTFSSSDLPGRSITCRSC